MKCKNCGGEVRLEEMYCPYCGSPNEEAVRHARDMQHYQNEFEKTRENVLSRAGRQSRTAVRIAVTAFLLLAIVANIFLQTNSYGVFSLWKGLTTKGKEEQYRQRIESFMADEDYMGLSAYCSSVNLYHFDDLYDEYYPVIRVANTYRYTCEQIMRVINHGRYSRPDQYMKYTSQYIQDFYDSMNPDNYSYNDSWQNPKIQEQIENIAGDMEAVFIAYLSMTPEEAKSMRTLSQGNRTILVERGFEKYMQEQEVENE